MTEIERKALELVNEIEREEIYKDFTSIHKKDIILNAALHRAIERHEAFRQEVSDAVKSYYGPVHSDTPHQLLAPFIITKPDPLVEVLESLTQWNIIDQAENAKDLRAALAKRGLEIREKSDG